MSITNTDIFIHVPYKDFFTYWEIIKKEQINIELYVSADDLDQGESLDSGIEKIGQFLQDQSLASTIHGPFYDLSPGAFDAKIRKVTCERYLLLMEKVHCLQPRVIVLHPSYEELRYGDVKEQWLQNNYVTWQEVINLASQYNLRIALENTFETEPYI